MSEGSSANQDHAGRHSVILVRLILGTVLIGAGIVIALAVWIWQRGPELPDTAPADTQPAVYAFATCRQCHAALDTATSGKTTDVIFSHTLHFGQSIGDCATCHVADTHVPDKTNRPTMDSCYQCHGTNKTSKASGRCLTCHPASFIDKPESHLVANWAGAKHAIAAKAPDAPCASCHVEKKFCASCHSGTGPPSHKIAGWATGAHQNQARANKSQCLSCHNEKTFCAACHARSRPASHQLPGWANGAHEHQAEANRAYCLSCHNEKTFCAACHARRDD